jgi:hypothetical protein
MPMLLREGRMRFEQLVLRVPGAEHRLRFHKRLTVVAGLSRRDREELTEVLLGTLAGAPTVASELHWVDGMGRRQSVEQTAEGVFCPEAEDDRVPPLPHQLLRLDVQALFELMYVDRAQLGLLESTSGEPKELAEARAALAALTDQLQAAQVARDAAEALRAELVDVDRELRQVESGRARRRYARLLMDLERVRIERAAMTATAAEVDADERLVAEAAAIRPLAEAWRKATAHADAELRGFGDRPRLDQHSMAGALGLPDRVPGNLDTLVEKLAVAEGRREIVSARLAGLMSTHLPSPTSPDVARLARADQQDLWSAATQAIAASDALEQARAAVDGAAATLVQELESAHTAVEEAEEVIEKRRFGAVAAGGAAALGAMALPLAPVIAPLALAGAASAAYWSVLAPRQQLIEARVWEAAALEKAGVPSYLAFHLRRLEAMQDPRIKSAMDRAGEAHRVATSAWRKLAGDIAPADALRLRAEVTEYARAVDALDGLSPEVVETRRKLVEEIEPEVERAREALMAVCRPFGIESPVLAADLVRQLAQVAQVARRQRTLDAAEDEARKARLPLEQRLTALGFTDGDLPARLAAFEEHAANAQERITHRAAGRPVTVLEAEIARLEDLSHSQYRPEFGTSFTQADAAEPDPEELRERREAAHAAWTMAARLVPDVSQINDRRSAVDRRVAMLQAAAGEAKAPSAARLAEVERHLQERIEALRSCGRDGESLPMLLDDCFVGLRADVKWQLLDKLDRISAEGQVVYLTDDADVAAWARRRSRSGAVGFCDPVPAPAPEPLVAG